MLPLERLQAAQQLIADTLLPTPMLLDHVLSERLGRSVWLKAICRETTQALIQVDDTSIAHAVHHLLYQAKLVAEPGAAVGVAALLEGAVTLPPEGDVVVVITGGNVSRDELEPFL